MSNWKTILTFTHPHEAHMAKNFLEAEGFDVIITDELTAQVNIGVNLLIREEDIAKAVPILQEGGYLDKPGQKKKAIAKVIVKHNTDKAICPFCKSDNISKKQKPNYGFLFLFFVGVFFPIFKNSNICHVCGEEWKWVKK